ncbi:MAG: UDP-glucuronic acid decarboxylase family protein, partial [Candidatus Helarchaeota archaeon]
MQQLQEILHSLTSDFDGSLFENSNVLVTGGAGFLGSWLCDLLIKLKANVICLDNLFSGDLGNIEHLRNHKNFHFIKHDITKQFFYEEKIDYIFHMASRASPFEFSKYPIQILKANTLGTWIVLGIAIKNESKLLYTSTSEVYGDPDPTQIPLKETYYGNVNPIGERSCYDEAKRAGEAFVMAYILEHGLDARILRIFNTYGPRIKEGNLYGRVIPNFITQSLQNEPIQIFGDGLQTRSFLFVSDLIRGIILAIVKENTKKEVINLGSNNEITILELANIIKDLTQSNSKIIFLPEKPDDPKRRCPDITKSKRILNWYPRISLKEGLKQTINWFKNKNKY